MTNLAAPAPEVVHETTDDANVQIALLRYVVGTHAGKYGVKIKDLDADEVVGLTIYPNIDKGLAGYTDTVNKSKVGPSYMIIGGR